MITTVTTTTTTVVSTTTTVAGTTTTVASIQLLSSLGIIGAIVLILLLVAKELLSSHRLEKTLFLSNRLNIAIVPLLMTFVLIVLTKIANALAV
jgi:Trk-type K+ transport system membrane component